MIPESVPSALNPTHDWIRVQFILAADALRRLPLTAFERPTGLRSGMPQVVRTRSEQFAALVDAQSDPALRLHMAIEADRRNEGRQTATHEQITALNRVAQWLLWLSADQKIVVMARAFGTPVARIARKIKCRSRQTVYTTEREAFDAIIGRLKK